jgi:hypothetical protein
VNCLKEQAMNARLDSGRTPSLAFGSLRVWAADLRDGPGSDALKADAAALLSALDTSDCGGDHLTLPPPLWAPALHMAVAMCNNHHIALPHLGRSR